MLNMERIREIAGSDETPVERALYTLKRSRLPTLVVEGCHDQAIYRWIERYLKVPKIDVLPVGGRDNLLEIYDQRSDFDSQLPVAFMADLDKWVFDELGIGGPTDYPDIIWTTGYSLENDLYFDGDPEAAYITSEVRTEHERALDETIEEFARDVARWAVRGRSPSDTIVERYISEIKGEYKLKLRGKNLFEVLFDFCSARNHLELCRDVFSTIDLDQGNPPLLSRLILKIQEEIKDRQSTIKKKHPDRKFIAESLFEKLSV